MTTTEQIVTPSYGLLRAAEAVVNWRALAMCGMAGLAFFLFATLSFWMMSNSVILGILFFFLTMVVGLIGYSAVGITLMRQAQGQVSGFADAIFQAMFTVHRFLGVGLLLLIGVLGVLLAAVLIFFVCKIPGLGPLLYMFTFPVVAVIIGVTLTALSYVGFPLAAPAIWEGNNTFETVARLVVIGRGRLFSVIVNMFVLLLLVAFLSFLVFGILFNGYAISTALSSAVGINPMGGLMRIFSGVVSNLMGIGGMHGFYGGMGSGNGMEMNEGQSYAGAFQFGAGLLFTIGMVIPFLTFINGTCLIYLQAVNGLSFGETEEKLRGHVAEAKRRTKEAQERANVMLQQSRTPAQQAPKTSGASVAVRTCASCNAQLAADDIFCGECGTKNPT